MLNNEVDKDWTSIAIFYPNVAQLNMQTQPFALMVLIMQSFSILEKKAQNRKLLELSQYTTLIGAQLYKAARHRLLPSKQILFGRNLYILFVTGFTANLF